MNGNEIAHLNASKLTTGLDKHEFSYWSKLLKASLPEKKSSKQTSEDSNLQNFSLGKRLTLVSDSGVEHPAAIYGTSAPSLIYKTEFTTQYLSSARSTATGSQPSILKIGIDDYYNSVTVVETGVLFKLFLIGTTRGKIKAVFLSKSENQNSTDGECIRKDKENENQIAGTGTAEQQAVEEFEMEFSTLDFIGHSSIITSLSLKNTSKHFVSGSLDGEVRLWSIPLHQCLIATKDHFKAVLSLTMAPKNDLYASGGSEGNIFLWSENSCKFD